MHPSILLLSFLYGILQAYPQSQLRRTRVWCETTIVVLHKGPRGSSSINSTCHFLQFPHLNHMSNFRTHVYCLTCIHVSVTCIHVSVDTCQTIDMCDICFTYVFRCRNSLLELCCSQNLSQAAAWASTGGQSRIPTPDLGRTTPDLQPSCALLFSKTCILWVGSWLQAQRLS